MNNMESHCLGKLKCAIALNNMGVSLLERRAYQQSIETLKDAVLILKRVFEPDRQDSPTSSASSTCEAYMDEALNRAFQRLSSLQVEMDASHIEVLSHDGGLSSIPAVCPLSGPSLAFPVTIENLEGEEKRNVDLESAILLHNFATAHFCLSRVSNTRAAAKRLRNGALSLASLGHKILSSMMKGYSAVDQLTLQDEPVFLVEVAALQNLTQVLTELGRISEAQESYRRLVLLLRALKSPPLVAVRAAPAA
jgi:tetratricopeptide (TPR) repeat protein